jgi:hypothetical protein
VLATCASGPTQWWSLPPVGAAGLVQLFGGTVCLDDFGAKGNAGDLVGIYTCAPGAAPQMWTLTTAGELKGINGLCVGAVGTEVGSPITLQACSGGTSQKWTAATTTAPPPTVYTPPPVTQAPSGPPPAVASKIPVPELPRRLLDTRYVAPTGRTLNVPVGANLQTAIDSARSGDVIVLQPGATYIGSYTLKPKQGTAPIVIRTAASAPLPAEGERMTPAAAVPLAKLLTPNEVPVFSTVAYANNYRIMGVEISATPQAGVNYGLVSLGGATAAAQTTLEQVPQNLILDRVYIHGTPTLQLARCVLLNSGSTAVIDSYLSHCMSTQFENQGILGYNGPGPFKIVNNHIEGGAENIMFGGADPTIPNLVPSDIEIRRNHMYKPMSWRGHAMVKNIFELKNAQRVLIEGNILENNWLQSQDGTAILLKSENQYGPCTWCVTRHVTFRYNRVMNSGNGMIMGGYNKRGAPVDEPLNNVLVQHNTFENIDGIKFGGQGIVFVFSDAATNIVMDHNSATPPIGFTYASWFHDPAPRTGFVMTNNVIANVAGSGKGYGVDMFPTYAPDMLFSGNAVVGGRAWEYAPGNLLPAVGVSLFTNATAGDFSLSPTSPLRGMGTGGSNIGADFAAILQKTAGVRTVNPTP